MTLGDSSEDDSDLFRILISSDIHLGYVEKDAERGLDSFNSFDELLGIGVERGVDMVTCFDLIYYECCLLILEVTMGQQEQNSYRCDITCSTQLNSLYSLSSLS